MNEKDVAKKVNEMGYYAENSEDGYIDVYGKLTTDKKGREHFGNIEYECVKFLKENGYELYKVGFGGDFVRHYAAFYKNGIEVEE